MLRRLYSRDKSKENLIGNQYPNERHNQSTNWGMERSNSSLIRLQPIPYNNYTDKYAVDNHHDISTTSQY
jgi:hypothetical protein